ncbi:undecaprenyl-diphosphate phosphatase [Papillibacter cinnamivorans]|uniref:Undecaprenyl-diphosphatase n=1 Tax=Papillibacter cinnamivorans DSM 12816 TaxID=1122930 RepID=A0A1W1YLJ5_9FIRM|nr:undecaprenyl-diphosphate phosphatase [Papillibacter cinnamivorans]SMC36993.1 undecaprenyl-diphosphatase [Papillibacter cinnamivorans DSM 12816]
MSYLMSALLGLVQGIAEFLPISSSGHLSIIQNLFHVNTGMEGHLFFDVLLHFGTLISIFAVYWQEIIDMIYEFFRAIGELGSRRPSRRIPPARRLVFLIIVGTLPLIVILPFKARLEELYYNTAFIGVALIFTGILLYLADRTGKGRKTERSTLVVDAVLVGLAQAVAVIPGLSRSGSTIAMGRFCGLDRRFAVRFSFLLSLPAVLGANIISLKDAVDAGIDTSYIPVYLVGVLVAAVSGYFAIRLVEHLADRGKFGGFAYYCWAVGAITLAFSLIF